MKKYSRLLSIAVMISALKKKRHLFTPHSPMVPQLKHIPYFFGYKTEFFFFQNNPKDLDPSCKMDLDRLDCLGRVNLVL